MDETVTLALLELAGRHAAGEITPGQYEAACATLGEGADRLSMGPHTFSSTQLNVEEASYPRSQGSPGPRLRQIAEKVGAFDLAEGGREDEYHVTARYGLHGDDADEAARLVAGFGPVEVTLGGLSVFECPDHDVLKVDVEGERLRELNRLLATLPHTDTHPKYQPHITLAYLAPGLGARHAGPSGLEGHTLAFDRLVFSDRAGNRTEIPLGENTERLSSGTAGQSAVGGTDGGRSTDQPTDHDDARDFAAWSAGLLNLFRQAGEDDQAEHALLADALDGTGWGVEDTPRGWRVRREPAVRMGWAGHAHRAPKGGISFNGRSYSGGQFIPSAEVEKAPAAEKEKLREAEQAEKQTAAQKDEKRKARGSVKREDLDARLAGHAERHELSDAERKQALAAARMLHRHHGEMAFHRLEELADSLETALANVGDEHPNSEGLKKQFGVRLAQLRLALEHAHGKGVTGEVKAPPAEEEKEKEPAAPAGRPADRGDGTPAAPEHGKAYNVPVKALAVDPSRFQYKLNVSGPAGVTDEFKQVKTWSPDFAGVISVWRDPGDGSDYVINGHHRYELADRLGVGDLKVQYVSAKDAKEARALGALTNIAEGRGTAVDAAKFMRDAGVGVEEFEKRGISLKGKVAPDAVALGRLSDRQFDRLSRGLLDEGKALAVARHLPSHALQDQLFALIDRRDEDGKDTSLRLIEEMARDMASAPTVKETQGGLFGDIESEESTFVPKNELKAYIRGQLSQEVNDYAAVASKRRAEKVTGGDTGNVLNLEKNRELADEAGRAKNAYDTLVNSKGPISEALDSAAADYLKAKSRKDKDAVKQRALDTVRAAVRSELAGPGEAHRGAEGPAAGPGEADAGGAANDAPAADAGRGEAVAGGLTAGPAAVHGDEDLHAALKRYDRRGDLPATASAAGGMFSDPDVERAREGMAKLPDGAEVVLTEGPRRGKVGRVRHEQSLDGSRRVVVQVDGDDHTTPVSPTAVEPLNDLQSWRTEQAAAPKHQGGMFGGGGFAPREQSPEEKAVAAVASEVNAVARSGVAGTVRGHRVEPVGIGRYRVTINGQRLEGDQRDVSGWIHAAGPA